MKNIFLTITKCLLNVMFFCGIPVTVAVPWIFRWYGQVNEYYKTYYIPQTIIFIISGIFACLIIYELRKMIASVEADNCFVHDNVKSLKYMGTYSLVIALVTIARLFLYPTPGVLVVILVFVIAGLFSKVLANVFDRAVAYKEENDMTI